MVEVGMYGNIFSRSREEFKILTTKHTLYYNLWELCQRLDVELEVDGKHLIKPVQQGDQSICDVATEKGYSGKDLDSINIVQKYLNLIHLSGLVLYDGKTLPDEVLEASGQMAPDVMSPKEKPTRNAKSL